MTTAPANEAHSPSFVDTLIASFTGSIGAITSSHHPDAAPAAVSTMTIVKEVIVLGMPLGLASLAQFSISPVMVAMVGRMVGVDQLGGTSLAFGLINATAFSFSAGFCGALETLLSYSYGRDPRSKLYGIYAQRMIILLLVIALFLCPVLVFADVLLLAIGQNASVTLYTGQFCRVALFGVFPAMMLELLRRYYACQYLNNPLSVNLVAGALVFPFLLWVFIKCFGYYGAPIGWVVLMVLMPGSLVAYLWYSKLYKRTWPGWSSAALREFRPMLRLAIPSMAMMLSEWCSLEVNGIIAGYAPPVGLAAFSIMYQVSGILWSLSSGIFIGAAVVVGNALGRKQNQLARRYGFTCIALAIVMALIDICVLALLRDHVTWFFTTDLEVAREWREMLPFFMLYHFIDLIQSTMMGIFRGCGLQLIGAVCIALVFSIIGVPLGGLLFFKTSLGVKCLWIGPVIGMWCIGLPTYVYMMFYYIPWNQLTIKEAKSALASEPPPAPLSVPSAPPREQPAVDVTIVADGGDDLVELAGTRHTSRTNSPHSTAAPHRGGRSASHAGSAAETDLHHRGLGHLNASVSSANSNYRPHHSRSESDTGRGGGNEGVTNASMTSVSTTVLPLHRNVLTVGTLQHSPPLPPFTIPDEVVEEELRESDEPHRSLVTAEPAGPEEGRSSDGAAPPLRQTSDADERADAAATSSTALVPDTHTADEAQRGEEEHHSVGAQQTDSSVSPRVVLEDLMEPANPVVPHVPSFCQVIDDEEARRHGTPPARET